MVDSMEPCKMLWVDPCHGNEIWARGGDPVAYWLVIITASVNTVTSTTCSSGECKSFVLCLQYGFPEVGVLFIN